MAALNTSIYNQILLQPEQVIEEFDLVYTNPSHLKIIREKNDDNFVFKLKNKIIKEPSQLDRLEKLVIPPAWNEVKISQLPNGHLQVVGRDKKKRKQYRYHPKWNKIRNQTKFYKMYLFGQQLPNIRAQVEADLDQKEWTQTKVLALIVRLMEETHIRIGNHQYAKRNETYGLTTLRTKHVNTFKDKIQFEFVGKKGKAYKVSVRNKKLIRLVNKCEEIPGWELFQYYDQFGVKQKVDSTMLNEYLQNLSGTLFTAKDFRTWAATIICFETLKNLGFTEDEKQNKKNILTAIDTAAKELGNTRNVCRKYYVHPLVIDAYEDGSIVPYFTNSSSKSEGNEHFTPMETNLMRLLKSFQPEF
ncbi:DNA topoisomerase IB [Olleya aquimaris]|uniref:DNA topoisomerase n=1 Tax=Olleya aquimaris TaxID=639310 RepID=A0A327RML9_9FLAO|nr:DNA topoisomerase IB [Olleya aquimaris]RAJ16814.1 DNA topoisomerase-1 [Olleya aquimaris]